MALMNAKSNCCDWENYQQCFTYLFDIVKAQVESGEVPVADPFNIFMLNFTPEQKFMIAKSYSQFIKNQTLNSFTNLGKAVPTYRYVKNDEDNTKIRIGYISWDFADHPLAHLLQGIFALHDRSKFHVTGFSLRPNDNSVYRQKIQAGCDEFY